MSVFGEQNVKYYKELTFTICKLSWREAIRDLHCVASGLRFFADLNLSQNNSWNVPSNTYRRDAAEGYSHCRSKCSARYMPHCCWLWIVKPSTTQIVSFTLSTLLPETQLWLNKFPELPHRDNISPLKLLLNTRSRNLYLELRPVYIWLQIALHYVRSHPRWNRMRQETIENQWKSRGSWHRHSGHNSLSRLILSGATVSTISVSALRKFGVKRIWLLLAVYKLRIMVFESLMKHRNSLMEISAWSELRGVC